MRSLNKYLLLILVFISQGCSNAPAGVDTEMALLIDQTDPLLVYPDADELSGQLRLKQDMWQGIQITITYISDKDVNNTQVISLEKESRWTGNTTLRKAKVEHFINELRKALNPITGKGSLGHSIIYRSVAKQLNALKAVKANKKYLLIYSDLMENDRLNFYKPQTFSLIQTRPERIRHSFENTVPVNNMSGIEVSLLYDPPTYEANNTYMTLASFYKQFLEAKGAKIHIEKSFNP